MPYVIEIINAKSMKNLELKKNIIHFLLNNLRGNEVGVKMFEKNEEVVLNITDMMKEGDDILSYKCKSLLILHFNVAETSLI
jgi:hypothetical protein